MQRWLTGGVSVRQASSASGRAMWKRQVANQQSKEKAGSGGDAAMARISLPSGEQIHDMQVANMLSFPSTSVAGLTISFYPMEQKQAVPEALHQGRAAHGSPHQPGEGSLGA
jgi:ADP-glucose pyrophosphorylase